MPVCSICIDELKTPVSLPCGHVFCHECIVRVVNAARSYTTMHTCPACRAPYPVVTMDPGLVPEYLRPHLLPSIRRIYLDDPDRKTLPPSLESAECGRMSAENVALRVNCGLWRKRAEVHAAATLGLLGLARQARDCAIQMKRERDEWIKRYSSLKRCREEDE
ncbi:hypothetical protein FISHEDRAFT_40332 [Fistulina hepatica ATCC 64428]|uniref:RING-type domain-containing protein n=1 Tax=Fistulina hepatica ATCC 64428 TaxID=1128425 RepID=A0A0D7AHX6_9AGAR|nr:hypothetical protein FISHEDRAFT_40332 [Fistulina hepatica ATCC 64428]